VLEWRYPAIVAERAIYDSATLLSIKSVASLLSRSGASVDPGISCRAIVQVHGRNSKPDGSVWNSMSYRLRSRRARTSVR